MKKKIFLSMMVMVLSASLFACGSKKVKVKPTETTGEIVIEDSTTTLETEAETETETEPETEIETEELPFAEEKGFEFSNTLSYTTSYSLVITNDDATQKIEYPEYTINLSDGFTCDIVGVETKDSDEEGYIDVKIVTKGSFTPVFHYDASLGDGPAFKIRYSTPGLGLFDIYTGRLFPSKTTYGDEVVDVSADVEWDGVTYTVSYGKEITWDGEWGEWDHDEMGNGDCTYYGSNEVIINIHMPKNYDGLALYANISDKNKEVSFEIEEEVDYSEKYLLGEEEGKEKMEASDYYVITLKDILIAMS